MRWETGLAMRDCLVLVKGKGLSDTRKVFYHIYIMLPSLALHL